jgi:hypothetical protein
VRRIRTSIGAAAVVGALALAVALPAGAASPLSPADFRRTANGICRQGHELRAELAAQSVADLAGTLPSGGDLAAFVEQYRSIVQQQVDALHALPAPRALKSKVDKMLAAAETALKRIVADPALLGGEADPFAKTLARARALGLSECEA